MSTMFVYNARVYNNEIYLINIYFIGYKISHYDCDNCRNLNI